MDVLEHVFNMIAPIFVFSWAALVVIAFIRQFYKKFHKAEDWITTSATTTGKLGEKIYSTRGGARYVFTEYEITYRVNGQTLSGYFDFYPGVDPNPPYPEGTILSIRYREKHPKEFEVLDVIDVQ